MEEENLTDPLIKSIFTLNNFFTNYRIMLKNLFTLLLLLGFILPMSYAQTIDENRQFFRENFEKKELYITMRDGVRLFTSVYAPKDKTQSYPLLMMRTPYSCSPYGPDEYTNRIPDYYTHLMNEGYIFVIQDVRGKYMSEGEYVDVRPFIPNKTGQANR
jgi:predicted acyl esterase